MACGCSDARDGVVRNAIKVVDDQNTAAGRVALPESVAERCAYSFVVRGRLRGRRKAGLLVSYR